MLTPKENLIILGCATAAAVVVIPTGCLKGGASVSYFIARVMLFFFFRKQTSSRPALEPSSSHII